MTDDTKDKEPLDEANDAYLAAQAEVASLTEKLRAAEARNARACSCICHEDGMDVLAERAAREKAEAEVAENDGVIKVWRRRAEAAERERDAALSDLRRTEEARDEYLRCARAAEAKLREARGLVEELRGWFYSGSGDPGNLLDRIDAFLRALDAFLRAGEK